MPMNSIPWASTSLWGDEERYVVDALRSTWVSGGKYVERFEDAFSAFAGTPHVISVANGTAALHLAYIALGIGPGDEVIVPGFAFMAAANVALLIGAKPVFAEVDPKTWCMTAATAATCLTPRTRAIVPVHTYGNVCDMHDINRLAREAGVTVIEDAAEAIGSRYNGQHAGTVASVGVFSFHATKTITTGEGGAVVTDDPDLATRLRLFRSHGVAAKRYWHEVAGHNFRLTNLQAAMGCGQLEHIEQIMCERKRVYDTYRRLLVDAKGLTMQEMTAGVEPVVWAVALKLDRTAFPQGRDAVMEQMSAKGIETRPGFYPASAMHHLYGPQVLPVCDEVGGATLVLPSSPAITAAEIEYVCETLRALAC